MSGRLSASFWPGAAIALGLFVLIAAIFWTLISADGGGFDIPSRTGRIIRISLIQASLSTALSLAIGLTIAWALSHQPRFPGRGLFVTFLSLSVVLPSLIVVLGLVAVLGRAGWVSTLLQSLGGEGLQTSIYGLGGIIIAHAYLNASFGGRVLLERLEAIPENKKKLVQSLGLTALQRFRAIEFPAVATTLVGLGATIFLLCFTSFAVVLTLGGSPRYNTLEVAIFEALRVDFDIARAVNLALIQLAICAAFIVAASRVRASFAAVGGAVSRGAHWPEPPVLNGLQKVILLVACLAFALPLAAIVIDGLRADLGDLVAERATQRAFVTSLSIAIVCALLSTLAALFLGAARRAVTVREKRPLIAAWLSMSSSIYLAFPALVLGLGFFLIARALPGSLTAWSVVALILANALMALPFSMILIAPAQEKVALAYDRLSMSLGVGGFKRFSLVEWPLLRRDVGIAFAVAFCLSFGDLSVIALFGTQDFTTLPYLLYQKFGSYRTDDAAGVGLILLATVIIGFAAWPRLIGGRRDA
ncbi:MAG: thiamine/thiamine pyrophosphate ABC transporter permease ThiP [Pseudomonadota bacterium]